MQGRKESPLRVKGPTRALFGFYKELFGSEIRFDQGSSRVRGFGFKVFVGLGFQKASERSPKF